jgi:DNA-binding transcriptional LysR family regulator
MMDWNKLEAFRAVAQHGGFSAAARSLGKTQSAVSQAVLALERELGQPLFARRARRVTPTQAGSVLLEHAERAAAELGQAERKLDALRGIRGGRLVIGTSDTLAYYVLPPVLSAFRARHPDVELVLETRPSPATALALANGEVDVGVTTLPLPPGLRHRGAPLERALHAEPLRAQPEVLIAPRAHPFARRKRVRFADLAREPLLLLGTGSAGRDFVDRELQHAAVRPRVAMEMNSVELLKRMVELGFGLSIVPALAVQREVAAGALAAIPIGGARMRERAVGLLLDAAGPSSPAAGAFAEQCRAVLARPHRMSV